MFSELLEKYNLFIDKCYVKDRGFKLCVNSEISPYATCFAIFGKNLINNNSFLQKNKLLFNEIIRSNLYSFKKRRMNVSENIITDKPYLQLLTFSLSALSVLKTLKTDPLEDFVLPIVNQDLNKILEIKGTFKGIAGTGNLAMFYAILMIHSQKFLNVTQKNNIQKWVNLHLSSMNKNGFWGDGKKNPHLQFQNGYHQYEVLHFLDKNPIIQPIKMEIFVQSLSDKFGHFAPYPGGGGCFDYDAIFLLTLFNDQRNLIKEGILKKAYLTLFKNQNQDGGFCESKKIRPVNVNYFKSIFSHVYNKPSFAKLESLKYCLNLVRSKHSRISTHWTDYDREWEESNLWDSWFRVLAIAQIDNFFNKKKGKWGFINYPGIGYGKIRNLKN